MNAPSIQILQGDCREQLRLLPSDHFHTVVTSPPYWGLRDYETEPLIWDLNPNMPDCQHVWHSCGKRGSHPDRSTEGNDQNGSGMFTGESPRGSQGFKAARGKEVAFGGACGACGACGAWMGHLGLEPTIELYVKHMVEIFDQVKRVLRPDGTCWLNLGDTYNFGKSRSNDALRNGGYRNSDDISRRIESSLKQKDLCGVPWRVAFALQSAGWYLRADIIWSKTNPMPESINDRPTKSHEYIFLLTKSPHYFYDSEAIKEPVTGTAHSRGKGVNPKAKFPAGWESGMGRGHRSLKGRYKIKQNESFSAAVAGPVSKRNRRTVWTLSTQPCPDAHFATFPERLIEPCIQAGAKSFADRHVHVGSHQDPNNANAGETNMKDLGFEKALGFTGQAEAWKPGAIKKSAARLAVSNVYTMQVAHEPYTAWVRKMTDEVGFNQDDQSDFFKRKLGF